MNETLTLYRSDLLKPIMYLENRAAMTNLGGTLHIDTTNYNSGTYAPVSPGSHTVGTNNERFDSVSGFSSVLKHNNWNEVTSDYPISRMVTITASRAQIASFITLSKAAIQYSFDGVLTNDSLPVLFNDPWYVKDNENTQSGMFDFLQFNSPLSPTGRFNRATGGVFKDQGLPDWIPPYYSAKAISPQTKNISGKAHTLYFQRWISDSTGGNANAQFQYADSLQTGVVFKSDSAGISALLKGTQLSNTATTLSNNSQRKIVRTTDGYLHFVYESMNNVWYERSTDNGVTWDFLNDGKPLSTAESKCPAIDGCTNDIIITFQEKDGDNSKLRIQVFHSSGTPVRPDIVLSTFGGLSLPPYSKDMNPVITWGTAGRGMLLAERITQISSKAIGYMDFTLGSSDNYEFHVNNTLFVSNTDTNSTKPSISYPDVYDGTQYNDIFHLAWQQNNSNGSSIKYCTARYINNALTWSTAVSLPSSAEMNHSPSIIDHKAGARVVFLKNTEELNEQTLEFRDPVNTSRTWSFGNAAYSPTITRQLDSSYFIGWSQPVSTGWNNYWLNNSLSANQIFDIPNVHGRDMQLTNGGARGNTKAVVFTGSSAPYAFSTVPIWDAATPDVMVATGVSGTVNYAEEGGVSFQFELGDVTNDGDPVSFVEADPDFYINTEADMNEYLTTVPFVLNNSSEFFYSVSYSCSNPEVAALVFANGGGLLCRVELVDENTSEILAVYDSVIYSATNTGEHDNFRYQVNCGGIGTRTVRLRLQIHGYAVPEGEMMMGQMMSPIGGDILGKAKSLGRAEQIKFWKENGVVTRKSSKERTMTFRGEMIETGKETAVITEYSLGQNYPNPFNPVTTISYALPKEGMVTLKVYDILGKEAAVLVNEEHQAGAYTVPFNASALPSGTYFYELRAGDFREVRKMMMVR